MVTRTSYTYPLDSQQQKSLIQLLRDGNYRPIAVEHAVAAAETDSFRVCLYKSGKCLVQGKGAEEFVSFVLEPLVLQEVSLGYEDILDPDISRPHMGIDESGKGDFFGPMVVVAVFVDESLVNTFREMDVKDSKRITSDDKALSMGRDLRNLLGNRFSVVKIGPEAYNRLYSRMRNVNLMLAWAHARAIENLLEKVPDCPRAISDQFGNKSQVEKALMKEGRRIELFHSHRAESDPAVAAASVIARELFLRSLQDLVKKFGRAFPKGASAQVREAAVELARKEGADVLLKTVKCHFKTTDAVLQELGKDRSALGPDGRATSKPTRFRGRRER